MVGLDRKIFICPSSIIFLRYIVTQAETRLNVLNIHHRIAGISLPCDCRNGRDGQCGVKEEGAGLCPFKFP